MILFDGVALETIAPVRIEDIRVGPVELNPVSRPRAINAGSDFVRMRCGTRTVAVTFGLQRENKITRQAALLAISEWAKTDKEYRLELPLYADKYLQCVCTGKPEPGTVFYQRPCDAQPGPERSGGERLQGKGHDREIPCLCTLDHHRL